MKKQKTKLILLIALVFLLGVSTTYAVQTLYKASEVGYDNSSSGTSETEVQGALDELYELSKTHCPDGYICTKKLTGAEMLIEKANDASLTDYHAGNKGEMYTFTHEATEQTGALTDYRYIGNQPNNYITFDNETWRIIGVIEGRIKIIRDEAIGEIAWDSEGVNDWSTASLQQTLNNGTGSWTLSEEASNQVEIVTWYLGGSSTSKGLSGEDYYAFERGITVYGENPTRWGGKVGLMYPSDYIYTYAYGVDDTCYNDGSQCVEESSEPGAISEPSSKSLPSNGWLYEYYDQQWTISARSHVGSATCVYSDGSVGEDGVNFRWYTVRPTVHLRSDIVLSGSGTVEDPYVIVN